MRHELLDRTMEAIVFTWEGAARQRPAGRGQRPSLAPLRAALDRLCGAGVDVAIVSKAGAALVQRRLGPRPGTGHVLLSGGGGAELIELGPDGHQILRSGCTGGMPQAMRDILAVLAGRGVGPGLILIIGVIGGDFGSADGAGGDDRLLLVPEAARAIVVSVGAEPAGSAPDVIRVGGGRSSLLRLLDAQLRRRESGRVPAADEDPAWMISEAGHDPARRRVAESLFTLGSGGIATRGSREEEVPGGVPMVLAAGVYDGSGPAQHLLPGPLWTSVTVASRVTADRRVLDLRTGVLARPGHGAGAASLRSLRFASAAAPGVVAMRAEAPGDQLRDPGPPLQAPPSGTVAVQRLDGRLWVTADAGQGGGIGALAAQRTGRDADVRTVQRIAAYVACGRGRPEPGAAVGILRAAEDKGFDRLLADHRAAWAARWDAVDVRIPDDPDTQLALRFALFQLWSLAGSGDELAVGARGLSGPGYAGHVFWDADAFILPALVSIDPAAAAAMIRYRLRRLTMARARARADGRRGTRFPWESAAAGEDVTPPSGRLGGRPIRIRTGELEEHVTAAVAWAAVRCAEWSAGRRPPGLPLVLDTARYWESRCRLDDAGRAHIDNVMGPDEYHERVDDNAYTNVMARWNLRAAADAADRLRAATGESARWRELADRIVDGYDPATGIYEQFAGYFGLEPLLVADFATPPVAVDLLLGRDRVAASQLIKQPDVLMLHHLVPGEVVPGSLAPNLDYYGPRTAHGSSLSPAVTASLLARAGRPDEALEMLRTALALDLGDLTGTTAAGLHMANLGGVWQAVLAGFGGVRVQAGALRVDPRLPAAWASLQLRFRCLGRRVVLRISNDQVEINVDGPILAGFAGEEARRVAGHVSLRRPV